MLLTLYTYRCLIRELDFTGAVNVWVNLTIPSHSQCPHGSNKTSHWPLQQGRTPGATLHCHCRCQGWALLTFCPDGRTPLRASPGLRLFPYVPSQRCHCQRAAASHVVYFWKSLNFTVKDVPEVVMESSGGTEDLNACFLTRWSDSVNKTEFDSP